MAEANINDIIETKKSENPEKCEMDMDSINMESEEAAEVAMQRFREKSRNELMFELRRLQHGDRPVTGQGHKEMVDDFFAKRLQNYVSENPNVPSNVDNVEEHRPEAVVVEVQGLYEQHRVSQVLQSVQFRRQLENIIRGNVSSTTSRPQPTPRRRVLLRDNPPPRALRPDDHSSDESSESGWSDNESVVQTAPLRQSDVQTAPQRRSPHSLTQTRSRNPPTQDRSSNQLTQDRSAPPPTQDRSSNQPTQVRSAPPPTQSRQSPVNEDSEVNNRPQITWPMISDVQQEDMISEIRELVHQRIVSATLDGAFRTTLEVHMQNRIPENGAEVAEFVRSIESSANIRRNDFSHLGIAGTDDILDDISVASFTAQAVPYNHSNLKLSRELSSLKAQMQEMQSMLKLSFEMQSDIQRAIRQEVAAAMNNGPGVSNQAATASVSRPIKDDKCVICLDSYSDTVLYRCGHMCLCYKCGKDLQTRGLNCPVCRAPIRDIIKAYRSNNTHE